jgi:hypothetical protein
MFVGHWDDWIGMAAGADAHAGVAPTNSATQADVTSTSQAAGRRTVAGAADLSPGCGRTRCRGSAAILISILRSS